MGWGRGSALMFGYNATPLLSDQMIAEAASHKKLMAPYDDLLTTIESVGERYGVNQKLVREAVVLPKIHGYTPEVLKATWPELARGRKLHWADLKKIEKAYEGIADKMGNHAEGLDDHVQTWQSQGYTPPPARTYAETPQYDMRTNSMQLPAEVQNPPTDLALESPYRTR